MANNTRVISKLHTCRLHFSYVSFAINLLILHWARTLLFLLIKVKIRPNTSSFGLFSVFRTPFPHTFAAETSKKMKTNNRREAILSKTEYDIMSIIWDINRSVSAREIYELLDPKPAYTTLATEMRMLYEKGFVDYFKKDGEGKTHYYIAKIGKGEYVRKAMHDVKKTFFGGNLRSMLSYFIREEELSEVELINFLHEMEEQLTVHSS